MLPDMSGIPFCQIFVPDNFTATVFMAPTSQIVGHRFNPNKLLMDPYAKAIAGKVNWKAPVFSYQLGHPDSDLARNDEDDAWGMPKCVVIDPSFHWRGDHAPHIPWNKTIIYEVNVKGFTALHPILAPKLRGTYAGLASPPVIKYLKNLGITAVELMPVHDFLDDKYPDRPRTKKLLGL